MKGRKEDPAALEERLRLRLAGLCARSEQCTADLRTKIDRAGLDAEAAGRILGFLQSEKFLDDARFAVAYARDKARFAGWGPAKIRAGLAAKHIPSTMVAEAIDKVDPEDFAAALSRAAIAKSRQLDLNSRDDRTRLARHLFSRGFGYEAVRAEVVRLMGLER